MIVLLDFSVDEQGYFNRCAVGVPLSTFLSRLDFHLLSCSSDKDFFSFLSDLKQKVVSLSDIDWGKLQDMLPFDVPYDKYDTEEYVNLVDREA